MRYRTLLGLLALACGYDYTHGEVPVEMTIEERRWFAETAACVGAPHRDAGEVQLSEALALYRRDGQEVVGMYFHPNRITVRRDRRTEGVLKHEFVHMLVPTAHYCHHPVPQTVWQDCTGYWFPDEWYHDREECDA